MTMKMNKYVPSGGNQSEQVTAALTKREIEILELICKEFSTEEIASRLFVSTRTIDGHRVNILAKTGCKNVAGLVVYAIRNGIHNPYSH
ncbi:MAG: response regulator transcription factor [Bacteroidetes bacterium]|jgi:DNA-binding CsgD family transcriptional regulator|nr:response regulator transcription factor [Bacteroidota bacterium]